MSKSKQPKVKHTTSFKKPPANAGFWQVFWYNITAWTVRNRFWQKTGLVSLALIILIPSTMYGISQWYINKHKDETTTIGATFIPDYARYLEVDPEETLDAMINDLGIKHFRLVSYWKNHEAREDQYDFS